MWKLLPILVCVCLQAMPASAAGPACRHVSTWHLSRSQAKVDLVAGATASDYAVAAEKGSVLVAFRAEGGGDEERRTLRAPNTLMVRRASQIRVERDGGRPAHGTLQICRW